MGNYLYSVRAKNIQVDGLTVHALAFLTKPYYGYSGRMDRSSNMLAGKAESYWADKDKSSLVALITGDTFEEFQTVLAWDGRATCDDTPSFEGSKGTVGFLKRAGRKGWTLAKNVYNVTLGTMQNGILYVRTTGQFFTVEEAAAFVNANKLDGETAQVMHSGIQDGKCKTSLVAPTWYERLAS
jgi:hypothetical protein